MVTNPQNVFVMRDIACAGYVAGGNCDFFMKHGPSNGLKIDDYITDTLAGISKRLEADPNGEKAGSMLAFPLDPKQWESGKMDTSFSLTNRVLPWDTQSQSMSPFPSGDKLRDIYMDAFKLSEIHYGEDTRALENHDYTSQGSMNNAICFLGPHRVYNALSCDGHSMELVPGQGVSAHSRPDPPDPRPRCSSYFRCCPQGTSGLMLSPGTRVGGVARSYPASLRAMRSHP